MKRSGRVKWSELRVGMVLLFGFALLLWASFTGSGFTVFQRTNPLVAYFPEVNGLVSGAPVWMAGLEVGYVEGVRFEHKDGRPMVRVDFLIKRKNLAMLNSDAKAAVSTMGLMGDKYLDVQLGAPDAPPLAPGDELAIARSGDITTAFSGTPDMMERLSDVVRELGEVLNRVNRGEGFLGRLTLESESSANLDSAVVAARELLADLNVSQKRLTESIEETSRKISSLADAIESGDGSLARLVQDSVLYVNFSAMTGQVEKLLRRLDEGEGTAGKLVTEDEMYHDLRTTLNELQALIADIRENPKKYVKFSIF